MTVELSLPAQAQVRREPEAIVRRGRKGHGAEHVHHGNEAKQVFITLSFILIWAPRLWPQTAADWYAAYERQFWQEGFWVAGFRELPHDVDVGWFNLCDVDAGPVIGGYGIAASAFGVGATRAMGRMDHAYKMAAEALVASWPLPNGTLLAPRVLSNISDAPYLGEAPTLFALARRSVLPTQSVSRVSPPALVYAGILALLGLGTYEIVASMRKLRRWHHADLRRHVPAPQSQVIVWVVLLACSVVAHLVVGAWLAVVFLLAAVILPPEYKRPVDNATLQTSVQ